MTFLTSKIHIEKQSGETLNGGMDFSEWVDDDITLSSPSVTSSPSGLTLGAATVSGHIVSFTVEDGTHGVNYRVQVTVTTSDGETLIGDGILKVRDR
jgi:hypothetical protein